MLKSILLVFIGGGLGSVIRYSISYFFSIQKIEFSHLPLATVITNVLSCAIMSFIILLSKKYMSLEVNEWVKLFILIGFLGGFSTFSTFSFETYKLIKQKYYIASMLNVLISLGFGMFSFWIILKD